MTQQFPPGGNMPQQPNPTPGQAPPPLPPGMPGDPPPQHEYPPMTKKPFPIGWIIAIIAIVIIVPTVLIALLLSFTAKARSQAQIAGTKHAMSLLVAAIEAYRNDNNAYPGVLPNRSVQGGSGTLATLTAVGGNAAFTPTGTENMVLALCGGLVAPPSNGMQAYNAADLYNGMGPLNLTSNIYNQTRRPPYIAVIPGQNMPMTTNTNGTPWTSDNSGVTGTSDTVIPEFLDKFTAYNNGGRPIIYVRASVGNPTNDGNSHVVSADDTTTQYNYMTVLPYAIAARGDWYGFSGAISGTVNPFPSTTGTGTQLTLNSPYPTLWDQYFAGTLSPLAPRGANKYVLISAGPDGIFGDSDDLVYPF